MIITVSRKGRKIFRNVVVCSNDYNSYRIESEEDDDTDINAAKLSKPLLISLNSETKFELTDLKSGQKRIVDDNDKVLSGQMRLSSEGDQLTFFAGKELFKISMK